MKNWVNRVTAAALLIGGGWACKQDPNDKQDPAVQLQQSIDNIDPNGPKIQPRDGFFPYAAGITKRDNFIIPKMIAVEKCKYKSELPAFVFFMFDSVNIKEIMKMSQTELFGDHKALGLLLSDRVRAANGEEPAIGVYDNRMNLGLATADSGYTLTDKDNHVGDAVQFIRNLYAVSSNTQTSYDPDANLAELSKRNDARFCLFFKVKMSGVDIPIIAIAPFETYEQLKIVATNYDKIIELSGGNLQRAFQTVIPDKFKFQPSLRELILDKSRQEQEMQRSR